MIDTTTAPAANPAVTLQQAYLVLLKGIRSSGNWFYWIAGMSVVNTLLGMFDTGRSFIVGLGSTQFIQALASHLINEASTGAGSVVRVIEIGLILAIIAMFAGFGIFAVKGRAWAFIIGMVLYALDGLVFLIVSDWFSILFHLFVLYQLFTGVQKVYKLKRLNEAVSQNFTPA